MFSETFLRIYLGTSKYCTQTLLPFHRKVFVILFIFSGRISRLYNMVRRIKPSGEIHKIFAACLIIIASLPIPVISGLSFGENGTESIPIYPVSSTIQGEISPSPVAGNHDLYSCLINSSHIIRVADKCSISVIPAGAFAAFVNARVIVCQSVHTVHKRI